MSLRVVYLYNREDPRSECWTFLSLVPGLEGPLMLARDGLADVRDSFGATGFTIVDVAGNVVAEEFLPASKDALRPPGATECSAPQARSTVGVV